MENEMELSPNSPCIEICTLDDRNICRGCFRTSDEIFEWFTSDMERKSDILAAVRLRKGDGFG